MTAIACNLQVHCSSMKYVLLGTKYCKLLFVIISVLVETALMVEMVKLVP